jgi:solute:Na+ symporter, SSS family
MNLSALDWVVIVSFLTLIVGVGLSYNKESGSDLNSYFLGGRNMPWFLAGLSMVATTFAADTPLAVAEIVATNGIAGNWVWWSFLSGGMLTTFFFAGLWQRSGVITEAEFTELRYSGIGAKWLRVFKSIYLGLFMNIIVIGWVNVALIKLLSIFFGLDYWDAYFYTVLILILTAVYSTFSGFKGVVVTDAIQFCIAMTGCIILAVVVVNSEKIQGVSNLKNLITLRANADLLNFFPTFDTGGAVLQTFSLSVTGFFAFVGIQWWASWYPGAEPGGGGYVVQRILSTRNAKEAVWATLFFQLMHYCVRPWAWIIVGLCAVVLYSGGTTQASDYYVLIMKDFLPSGLRGLMLVAFFAAYMSTISTQLNWGASCLVNDVQKRLAKSQKPDSYYVSSAKIITVLLALLGIFVTLTINSVASAWGFLMQCGAGVGGVLILRWYWLRINVWSEITAMLAPFLGTLICYFCSFGQYESLIFTALFTTVAWILATLATPATDKAVLTHFYNKVHQPQQLVLDNTLTIQPLDSNFLPQHTQIVNKQQSPRTFYAYTFSSWLSATVMAYAILFFTGKIILLEWNEAALCLGIGLVSFAILKVSISKTIA